MSNETEKNQDYLLKLMSPLAKVFPDETPKASSEETVFTVLHGESLSFQLAFFSKKFYITRGKITVFSDIDSSLIHIRRVELVPSAKPAHPVIDDNYLRTAPGLFPDLLRNLQDDVVVFPAMQWHSLWVEVAIDDTIAAGAHTISFTINNCENDEHEILCQADASFTLYDCKLPEQTLIHTEWFHTDCLSAYYHVDAWSEKHFEIVENFIATAAKRGINMLLTPIHTPPLDTLVGTERPTVQLIDVSVTNGSYSFGFEKLRRFVDLCQRHGVIYFEMAHLFTQWGSKAAPKIMATVDGEYKRIFGWDTPAVGGEYTRFLQVYLKAIIEKVKEWGIYDNCYFHISDEPGMDNLENYRAALESVKDVLGTAKRLDALSDYNFYQQGLVPLPVPSNDHIQKFLDEKVEGLWTYYCTAQSIDVANRFMSMPSARNRVLGIQMYLFDIKGFLQWGYNFYFTQYSVSLLDPYAVTDAGHAFPSGDPFLVYPGADGKPEESIRIMVLQQAICDMRALQYLESLTSREHVVALIQDGLSHPITFKKYPKSDMYYLQLRNLINWEIDRAVHGN